MNEINNINLETCKNLINNTWEDDQEKILKSWGDKASCYKLMHDRSHKRYWTLNAWFSIPIIIFSTLTGTGNFAQETFSDKMKKKIILILGGINLLSAILLSIKGFLNVAEKGEAHKISSIDWDKLGRKIRVELSKKRINRQDCKPFLNRCQDEYNRLIETQPSIPTDILRWFNKLIETGEYDYNKGGCKVCIYDLCLFPCGLPMCEFSLCNYISDEYIYSKNKERKELNKSRLNGVELPEIIGRITPTRIAKEINNDTQQNDYRVYNQA